MISITDAVKENNEYKIAKKWLKENGVFTNTRKNTKEHNGLKAEVVEVTHVITFQRNGSKIIKSDEGNDLKKITINMYKSEL